METKNKGKFKLIIAITIIIVAIIIISLLAMILIKLNNNSGSNLGGNINENLISATDIASEPSKYYNKTVNYVVDDEETESNLKEAGIEWRIFYADSDNIYLITNTQIPQNTFPSEIGINTKTKDCGNFKEIINSYEVPEDFCTNNLIATKWLSKWISAVESSKVDVTKLLKHDNIQQTAYMLDTDKWSNFTNETYSEYAVRWTNNRIILCFI